jgi:hypothetical protein
VNVAQEELDAWARALERIKDAAGHAAALMNRGDKENGTRYADRAMEEAQRTLEAITRAGADYPGTFAGPTEVPLHLLATPAGRALLDALLWAQEAAAKVDTERGWTHAGKPCGYSEEISNLVDQLRVEVEGPQGRGEG